MKKLIVSLLSLFFIIQLFSQDTVKVFVALWDSPPKSDLYWGMKYGIKTYFSNDADWEPVKTIKPGTKIQERILFFNRNLNLYVDAMAYHSDSIKTAITEFVEYTYQADTNELVIYAGHDGLMDFDIEVKPKTNRCDAMVFSCVSDYYFSPYVNMCLSTNTLMAPEAYVVMAAIESWAAGDNENQIRKKTAKAYAKYQGCTISEAEATFLHD
jgi:hypothetical protein